MVSIRNTLLYALASVPFTSATEVSPPNDRSQCDDHGLQLNRNDYVGRKDTVGSGPFCASKVKKGILIRQIDCMSDSERLRSLTFYYTDGSDFTIGQPPIDGWKAGGRIQWNPVNDKFKHFKVWTNGPNGEIGRLDVALENGSKMDCGRQASWGRVDYEADRGAAGILIGIDGRANTGIVGLRPMFTKSAPSGVKLKALDIPIDRGQGLETSDLKTFRIINRFKDEPVTTEKMDFTESRANERTWNFKNTQSFGYSTEIGMDLAIPNFGIGIGTKQGMQWSTETVKDTGGYKNDKTTKSWSIPPMTIKPGMAKIVRVTSIEGKIPQANYKAKMEVSFKDGSSFQYETVASLAVHSFADMNWDYEELTAAEALKKSGIPEWTLKGKEMDEKDKLEAEANAKAKEEKEKKEKKEKEEKEEKEKEKARQQWRNENQKKDDDRDEEEESKGEGEVEDEGNKKEGNAEGGEGDDGDDEADSDSANDRKRAIPFQA